jgi:hypothetical protein
MSRLQSTLPLISTPSSAIYGSVKFRFPVSWKTLSRSADSERWEMVVPRMVRPPKLTAVPDREFADRMFNDRAFNHRRFANQEFKDLFANLPCSDSTLVRLFRWLFGFWHGFGSSSRG